jgi:two-component system OmpR family sensor kinase
VSLRSRLLIAIGIIALVALAIADVATYKSLESFLYQRIDQQLDASHGRSESQLNNGGTLHCASDPNFLAPGGASAGGPTSTAAGTTGSTTSSPLVPAGGLAGVGGAPDLDQEPSNAIQVEAVQVRYPGGGLVNSQSCPAYVDGKKYTPLIPTTIGGFTTAPDGSKEAYFNAPSVQPDGPVFRVRASSLHDGNLLIVAQPLGDNGSTLHRLLVVELVVTGAAVVIALIFGYWLVRLGLRPLRDMETTAESIAAGNLTERVPGENDKTEVGRLARTLNVMLARIESAFGARVASERRLRASEARLRRFVADASHELRTPIAAISAYAELFGRGASEQKADLERLMGGIRSETTRMEHLVADLLLLARLDEGRPMEQRSVDLVSLCAEAVQTASTVGPDWPVTFHASQPIEVMGDATSLRQVLDNLLANVRAHTPAGTEVRVTVEPEEHGAVITVADNGPGMEPEEAEHIFERFYRSDPSRSRAAGGAGLGLSIVSAIVGNHGGTVSAEGQVGVGTTFTVHLPLVPPAPDVGGDGPDADELPVPGDTGVTPEGGEASIR